MEERIRSYGIGAILALLVLVAVVVLSLIGKLDAYPAMLIGALALARLL